MPTVKPKLPQLKTPVSSTFPSELSALSATASARSPLPGFADFIKQEDGTKTPITPPLAYIDFLKSVGGPVTGEKTSGGSTPTYAPSSTPSTAASEQSDCFCSCEIHKSPNSAVPSSPFIYPSSAPTTSRLGSLRIPPSPADIDSPLSASSIIRSPFSARSARSPFDWDLSHKSRYFDIKPPKNGTRPSVRQVREIVTRTVTYTPRMSPAPKGKRRKLE